MADDQLRKSIEGRVIMVAVEVLNIQEPIDLNSSIVNVLAPESLDQVRLFMALEDEFEGTIPDEDLERIDTLNQAIDYIETRFRDLG